MRIRFLYLKGCPNAEPALNLLKQIMEEEGVDENVEVIEVESEEAAKPHHFIGSPTIQINGRDVEKTRSADPPLFGCRVYADEGRLSGLPPRAMIIEALRHAKGRPDRSGAKGGPK